MAALASSARQEIIDVLLVGPCSAAELAARLGRAADSLYHHLRTLRRVGLVVEHSMRRTSRRTEVVYAAVGLARRIKIEHRLDSKAFLRNWERGVATILRIGGNDFRRAVHHRGIVAEGSRRNLWCGRIKGFLTPPQLATANKLLSELFGMFSRSKPTADAELFAVTGLLVPCAPSRRRGRTAKRPKRAKT